MIPDPLESKIFLMKIDSINNFWLEKKQSKKSGVMQGKAASLIGLKSNFSGSNIFGPWKLALDFRDIFLVFHKIMVC